MYDVIIIGAGVVGGSIFRELTKYKLKVLVLEKENDVAMGTTKANSAIIHAGFDPKSGTTISKHNVIGNKMYEKLCLELDVPFKRNGAMVVAFNESDMDILKKLYENGKKANVEGLEILSREQSLIREPNLSESVIGALYAPKSGIVCPFEYTIALFENGVENGGRLRLKKEVTSIVKKNDIFIVKTRDGLEFKSKYVVNAAGVYADKIHNMICPEKFVITPRLGEYLILDKNQGTLFSNTIFQCPTKKGKGVLVTPTVHGNLLVGPDAIDTNDKEDVGTICSELENIRNVSLKTTRKINYKYTIKNFAGLRAISSTDDFIIEENDQVSGFIDVAGMKSPGLTSAPSVALEVVNILNKAGLDIIRKPDFKADRKQIRFMELSDDEKKMKIKEDPRYGHVICSCESITEGEIVDAIKRSFGILSIDGVKRRCRPGMGRCQGGFCGPKVLKIIAREYGIDEDQVVLDREGSFLLEGRMK